MFRNGPISVLLCLLVFGLVGPGRASAGWISTYNETRGILSVQEVGVGPVPQRGKLIRLMPGEVNREFCPIPGEKHLQVWDPRRPGKLLFEGKVCFPAGDVVLRLVNEGKEVKIVAVPVTSGPKPTRPPQGPRR